RANMPRPTDPRSPRYRATSPCQIAYKRNGASPLQARSSASRASRSRSSKSSSSSDTSIWRRTRAGSSRGGVLVSSIARARTAFIATSSRERVFALLTDGNGGLRGMTTYLQRYKKEHKTDKKWYKQAWRDRTITSQINATDQRKHMYADRRIKLRAHHRRPRNPRIPRPERS